MTPCTILVVDAEPMILKLLRSAIASPGVRVVEADSAEGALRAAAPHACLRQPAGAASDLESLYRRWMDARGATKGLIAAMRSRFAAQGAICGKISENLHAFFEMYLNGPCKLDPRQHSL